MKTPWWKTLVFRRMTKAAARRRPPSLRLETLESREVPAGLIATGADPGSAPIVTAYDADTLTQKFLITAYDASFTGGVNVAVGDVNGDGTPDLITAPMAGGGPIVNVYSGIDGSFLKSFTVGDSESRAGTSVAAADFDQDGAADIVVGAMRNGQPFIQVLRYSDGTALHGYTPLTGATSVNVAAGDVNRDGIPDVVAASGGGIAPYVVVFDGSTDATIRSFTAFEDTFTGGVLVSTGDLDGDGYADIIASAGSGGGPRVQVFSGKTREPLQNFFAYGDDLRSGARAYAYDANADGSLDLVTGNGTGQSTEIKAFDGRTLAALSAPSFPGMPVVVVVIADVDRTAPTVTLTSSATSPSNAGSITVTAAFNEDVTGFSLSGVTVTNGTASNLTTVDARTYTFTVVPTADGTVLVSLAAGAAADAEGNASTAADLSVVFDATAPVPTVSSSAAEPTGVTPIPFTVSFSEDVAGFDASDLTVTNGTVTNFAATSASTYTFDVVPTGSAVVQVSVVAGVATDTAGNANIASNIASRTFSTGLIGLTADALTTNLSTPTLTGTVSDSTATVTVTVGEQAITATVSGTTWSATIPTALTEGTYDIQVNAANTTSQTGALTVTDGLVVDFTAPVVASVTTSNTGPTNAPVTFTVTFSEPVLSAGVDAADFLATTVDGTFATPPTITSVVAVTAGDRSSSFTVTVDPGVGEGTIRLDVAEGATATDAAGNPLSVPVGGYVEGDTGAIDTVAPVVTIDSDAPDATDMNPIPFTITFGESVTGFDASDVTVSNGTLVNFAAAGSAYTFEVVPAGPGIVNVSVAAGAVSDAVGNASAAAALARTFEGTVTTAAITTTESDPTNAETIPVTVTFTDDVTGFDETDITVTNGIVSNFAVTSGSIYTFDITPTADGTVSVVIPAAAATDGAATPTAAASLSFRSDRTSPDATVTVAGATNSSPITFTIDFTEEVFGFDESDLVVTNGTVSSFTPVNERTYNVVVVPAADGTVTVAVPAGSATDEAGNPLAADVSGSSSYDTIAPTATISSTASEPTSASPIPFTITFSEAVTGFDVSDVTVDNGTVSHFAENGNTFTFDVTPTATGAVTVSIVAGVAADAAGNANVASDSVVRTFNGTLTIDSSDMVDTMPDVNAAEWQTQASGLKSWIVQGGSGTAVTSGSTVDVYYTGWLAADGTEFDSNRTDVSPVSFPLSNLIEGWKEGLLGMQPGEILRMYVPSALGYGENGSGSIPGNADLVFEVKLVATT